MAPSGDTRYHAYIDGSGHVDYPKGTYDGKGDTDHYVLACVLLDDAQRIHLENAVDELMLDLFPNREPRSVEMHAVDLVGHHPHPPWDDFPGHRRPEVNDRFRDILLDVEPLVLCQVMDKISYWEHFSKVPEPPALNTLRFLTSRLDGELVDLTGRSTLSIDDDSYEIKKLYRNLLESIRRDGDKLYPARRQTTLDRIHPVQFVDSRATRGIQAADYIAYWTFRAVEHEKGNRIQELEDLWRVYRGKKEPRSGYADESIREFVWN